MPEYSNRDRLCIMQEQAMWNAYTIAKDTRLMIDNSWTARIRKIEADLMQIANELCDYNDQWEESDE